jgi:tRNA A37 methylthiotransferase MiaB
MIDLGNKLSATFREQMIGKTVNVLVENCKEDKGNLLTGFSGNYLRVSVDAPDTAINQILPITLKSLSGETLRGSIAV